MPNNTLKEVRDLASRNKAKVSDQLLEKSRRPRCVLTPVMDQAYALLKPGAPRCEMAAVRRS